MIEIQPFAMAASSASTQGHQTHPLAVEYLQSPAGQPSVQSRTATNPADPSMMSQSAFVPPPSPRFAYDLFEASGSSEDDDYYDEGSYGEGDIDDVTMGGHTDDEGTSMSISRNIFMLID
jgi:hypothetical protein